MIGDTLKHQFSISEGTTQWGNGSGHCKASTKAWLKKRKHGTAPTLWIKVTMSQSWYGGYNPWNDSNWCLLLECNHHMLKPTTSIHVQKSSRCHNIWSTKTLQVPGQSVSNCASPDDTCNRIVRCQKPGIQLQHQVCPHPSRAMEQLLAN